MLTRLACVVLLTNLVTGAQTTAGKFNRALSIGDDAPAWVELPGTDGNKHALADLNDKDVVVVVFTCNSCDYAAAYEDRLIAFAKKHAGSEGKVTVVAINVNTIADDRLDKMKERAKEKEFPFAYLFDESQKIGKLYGATYTPEFFVLNKSRKVAYTGAMDDRSPPGEPKLHYLENAVEAVLNGEQQKIAETQARGCRIRYVKPR